jgi:Xaa-Pro aminopeptidase
MRHTPPPPEFFARNRAKLARLIKPGHAAIFFSGDLQGQNADFHHPFVVDSNFYYLTGIDQEEVALLLFPDAPKDEWRELLFLPDFSKFMQQVFGAKYSPDEAAEVSGGIVVRDQKFMDRSLIALLPYAEGLYIDVNEHENRMHFSRSGVHDFAARMQSEYPGYPLLRAAPLLRKLRSVKEAEELRQIRIACSITDKAVRRAAGFVRPGVWEYEVEAEIQHELLRNRASGSAFPTIVASGSNSCVLHYITNQKECLPGEVLQLDLGADYGHYSSDVSRVLPVGGRFSPRQREVYMEVWKLLKSATEALRPGVLLEEHQNIVNAEVEESLLRLGLISRQDIDSQNPKSPAFKKFFMHGVSHHLGLDTHDLSDRFAPLEPGMVLTVEPGIYIPAEGFGMRLENDVLITAEGYEDLTASIPLDPEEIEDLMNP